MSSFSDADQFEVKLKIGALAADMVSPGDLCHDFIAPKPLLMNLSPWRLV
jgi:hypothetical protein